MTFSPPKYTLKMQHPSLYGRLKSSTISLILAISTQMGAHAATPEDSGWVSLFNGKDFSNFYTFIGKEGMNKDAKKVFRWENGMLHGMPYVPDYSNPCYIATNKRYTHYQVRIDYKFGPYGGTHNGGLLYHIEDDNRKPGDNWWPKGNECQMLENEAAFFYPINTMAYTTGDPSRKPDDIQYLPSDKGGVKMIAGGKNGIVRTQNRSLEKKGDWNTLEILVLGDSLAHHILNGVTVIRLTHLVLSKEDGGNDIAQGTPLAKGSLALEVEGQEVWYRNFYIRELTPDNKPVSLPKYRIQSFDRQPNFTPPSSMRMDGRNLRIHSSRSVLPLTQKSLHAHRLGF